MIGKLGVYDKKEINKQSKLLYLNSLFQP
jgi:hypothetical protein